MRSGDRFDLPSEGIHGAIFWMHADEQTGNLMGFAVAMDDGRFAAIDPAKLPAASDTLQ